MRKLYSFVLIFVYINPLIAQVWEGNYHIKHQAQADTFIQHCKCTSINGDLIITNRDDIEHLDSLFVLVEVKGSVDIINNKKIFNFEGLNNLISIGENLTISYCDNLTELNGFQALQTINSNLVIENNNQLQNITAFQNLKSIDGALKFSSNNKATTLNGFDKLSWITEDLSISSNNNLEYITGFQQLESVYYLSIAGNNALVQISEFNQLVSAGVINIGNNLKLNAIPEFEQLRALSHLSVSSNLSLEQVYGFSHLNSIQSIDIISNPNLTHIDGFFNIKTIQRDVILTANNNLSSVEGINSLIHARRIIISNRNLRNLDAFAMLKSVDYLYLSDNIHLKSIDNFSNVRIIDELNLSDNIQLNSCCLVNCWINEGIIDESKIKIERNDLECIDISTINEHCPTNNCKVIEEKISDLYIVSNPATDYIQLNFITNDYQPIDYLVFSLNDQVITKGTLIPDLGYNLKDIELTSIKLGLYFLALQHSSATIVAKFVKQ